MILQELTKYYDRKLEEGDIAPPGFEYKEIPYLIVIKPDGSFVRFESTWQDEKQKRARKFLLPKGVKRSRGIESNLLWDNPEYIFGGADGKVIEKQSAFLKKLEDIVAFKKNAKLGAILHFANKIKIAELKKSDLWGEINESGRNLTFKINFDSDIVCGDTVVHDLISEFLAQSSSSVNVCCLISGKEEPIARLHDSIQGVAGANPTGASIVSFNLTAFESYGKEQSFNSPVSQKSMFAYTTALNTMLGRDSRQKLRIGDATVVFWAGKKSHLEEFFIDFFNPSSEDKIGDDRAELEGLKLLYNSPINGKESIYSDKTPFFVLGLSPNAARLSVRFWIQGSVGEVASNIRQHFDDLRIEHADYQMDALPLFWLLKATAKLGKSENIHPILAGEMMQSILTGRLYPRLLLLGVMNRLHADHDTDSIKQNEYPRMALLKAYLNRNYRITKNQNFREVKETMDEKNTNTAYRLGRAFAVLEKVQRDALGENINSTIRDRYFTSASTRPATVFPGLITRAQHHITKAEYGAVRDKLLGEILEPVNGFPRIQSLEEQGLFSLGYYHQKRSLYKKKDE